MSPATHRSRVRHASPRNEEDHLSTRLPFENGEATAIVHCAHHRSGSTWLDRVLRECAAEFGLQMQYVGRGDEPDKQADILFYRHARFFDRAKMKREAFRGLHVIRDPRDVVASSYFYHLWTNEQWAHVPRAKWGGKTYQQYLRSHDRDQGLAVEMRRSMVTLRGMAAWDYDQPEFLELKYEDLVADEEAQFRRAFRHFGFSQRAIGQALEVVQRWSFKKVTNRAVGQVEERSHLRSGRPGQWQDVFTADHRSLFADLTGDLLSQVGYPRSEE